MMLTGIKFLFLWRVPTTSPPGVVKKKKKKKKKKKGKEKTKKTTGVWSTIGPGIADCP